MEAYSNHDDKKSEWPGSIRSVDPRSGPLAGAVKSVQLQRDRKVGSGHLDETEADWFTLAGADRAHDNFRGVHHDETVEQPIRCWFIDIAIEFAEHSRVSMHHRRAGPKANDGPGMLRQDTPVAAFWDLHIAIL
jgi:hypothetical protein